MEISEPKEVYSYLCFSIDFEDIRLYIVCAYTGTLLKYKTYTIGYHLIETLINRESHPWGPISVVKNHLLSYKFFLKDDSKKLWVRYVLILIIHKHKRMMKNQSIHCMRYSHSPLFAQIILRVKTLDFS